MVLAPLFGHKCPHLGLGYLAAVLRENGVAVDIHDLDVETYLKHPTFYGQIQTHTVGRLVSSGSPYILTFPRPDLLTAGFLNGQANQDAVGEEDSGFLDTVRVLAQEWIGSILKHDPDIVGLSTCFTNIFFSVVLAYYLKLNRPDLSVVIGGPGSANRHNAELLLRLRIADAVVVGEGEKPIVELAQMVEHKDFGLVRGVAVLGAHDVVEFRGQDRVMDLDNLPYPDFSGFSLRDYCTAGAREHKRVLSFSDPGVFSALGETIIPVASSRGCVNNCSYCLERKYLSPYRKRSVESVIEEIRLQTHKYGSKLIHFQDSLFTANAKWLRTFCDEAIKNKLDIFWWCYAQPVLDRETLSRMAESGCFSMTFGLETGSEAVARRMNKRLPRQQVLRTLKSTYEAKIIPIVNFIVGYPGESTADFADTLAFVSENDNFLVTPQVYQIRHFWTDDPNQLCPYGITAKCRTLRDVHGNAFQFDFLGPELQLPTPEQNVISDRMRNIWDIANSRRKSFAELEDLLAIPFLDKERIMHHALDRLSSTRALVRAGDMDTQTIRGLTTFEKSLVQFVCRGKNIEEIIECCSKKIGHENQTAPDEAHRIVASSVLRLIGLGALRVTQE